MMLRSVVVLPRAIAAKERPRSRCGYSRVRQFGKDFGDLERARHAETDPLMLRHAGDVAAVEQDRAGGRR